MPAPSPARRLFLLAERHQAPRAQIVGAVAVRLAQDLGVPVPAAVTKLYPEHRSPVCRTELEVLFDRFPLSTYGDPLAWAIESLEGRQAHRTKHHTPPVLAKLMLDLAGDLAGTVYDPAAGTGGLLLAAAVRNPGVALIGQELDPISHTAALINAELAGMEINLGEPADTLAAPQHPALAADLVLANPPWVRATNRLWVEHCLQALADDGRAVLLLPASVCTDNQGGWALFREHLVTNGLLRRVIALPRSQFRGTAAPGVIWVIERGAPADGVLMVDARDWEGGTLPAGVRASVEGVAARGWQLNPPAYAGEPVAGTTLGDVADIQSSPSGEILGRRHWLAEGEAGIPVIEARNLDGQVTGERRQVSESDATRLAKYRVLVGDVLIARRGRLSRVAVVGDEHAGAVYGTSVIRIRPRAGGDSIALMGQLRSPQLQEWLLARSTGSTLPHITASAVGGVSVYSAEKLDWGVPSSIRA
ncbi:N-6 DNA methylase [Leucobacter salsicius]|uniref:N-6 DNA methylase n=1 Tax=Leucobacter salsicius TaxID=664638 RepID=UPI0003772755|nr:N-6 DNA methylase [Leucobacter salsicius]